MAIPGFNQQGLLPPYDGDGALVEASSPYQTTTSEICHKFGTTPVRREILRGFLRYRALLTELRLVDGFQWVDGRFLEEDRGPHNAPENIQVVTFCKDSPLMKDPLYAALSKPLRVEFEDLRKTFRVDAQFVSLDWPLVNILNHTRFHAGVLSHQSETGLWKGMLQINLNTSNDDTHAMAVLTTLEAS